MKIYLEIAIGFIFVASVTTFILVNVNPTTIKQPEALITKDGCTIYKWYDKGERMYYTKCDDDTSQIVSK